MLAPELKSHNMKVGRDYLFGLLGDHGLLIRSRRRRPVTTNSRHWMRLYPRLIVGQTPSRPEQLWVSDITYVLKKGELGGIGTDPSFPIGVLSTALKNMWNYCKGNMSPSV